MSQTDDSVLVTPSAPGGTAGPSSQTQDIVAPTGRRQAFKELRRQLTNEDLTSPGVQKMLLDELEQSEAQCEVLQGYITRYYDADKLAAVLQERLRGATALEICFATGVGLGGAIVGLAPLFWDTSPRGPIALILGIALISGAVAARILKR
jgi:hypothetical protein